MLSKLCYMPGKPSSVLIVLSRDGMLSRPYNQLSHNQTLVDPNHVNNQQGSRTNLWLGLSLSAFTYPV